MKKLFSLLLSIVLLLFTSSSTLALEQDLSKLVVTDRYQLHDGLILEVGWSPDGIHVASSGIDDTISILNIETGETFQLLGHSPYDPDGIRSVRWSPTGEFLASTGVDGRLIVWDVATGSQLVNVPSGTRWSYAADWSPDGTKIATGSYDGIIRVFDSTSGTLLKSFNGHGLVVWDVDWTSDGSSLIAGDGYGNVQYWDYQSGALIKTFHGGFEDIYTVSWSPNDNLFAAGGRTPDQVQIWNVANNSYDQVIQSTGRVYGLDWHPYNNIVAFGDVYKVRFYNTDTQSIEYELNTEATSFYDVKWSVDGTKLAGGGWDGYVYIIGKEPVQTPSEAINDLIDTVTDLNLKKGIDNSLDAKLNSALNALDDLNQNNDVAAINSLQAFINAVEAQRGNSLTDAQADMLINIAQSIIDSLGV